MGNLPRIEPSPTSSPPYGAISALIPKSVSRNAAHSGIVADLLSQWGDRNATAGSAAPELSAC